ncbi:Terpene synthase, metal-binding domain-containing protein [Canna indica]|uniref:Terpene synthase, metal-binding domain-containing protein n=1 Tax=Canna indica TaxID=4628 RepID=A0AAQ3KYH0_9LILI|nr:Terpene synthase, metal-binding domain-containing protein [Canna indica]
MSDARISWAKNGILITVVDDFFDVGGSREDLWLRLVKCMTQEAEWQLNKELPSVDEYMTNGCGPLP